MFQIVEFPAIVENIDKAEQMLGGQQQIEKAFKESHLGLNFRPENPSSHPIQGDIINADNWYIMDIQDKDYNIMGRIDKVARYREMADFQYQSIDRGSVVEQLAESVLSGDIDQIEQLVQSGIFDQQSPDLPMPVYFSRQRVPFDSRFDRQQQQEVQKNIPYMIVEFEDKETPTKNIHDLDVDQQVVQQVQDLFKERPIWNMSQIVSLVDASEQTVRTAVQSVAYQFISGPWRRCWTVFGYDPRQQSEASLLQNFEVRAIQDVCEKFNALVTHYDCQFRTARLSGKMFQLIDVMSIKPIARLIDTSKLLQKPDKHYGWLPRQTYLKLRDMFTSVLTKGISAATPPQSELEQEAVSDNQSSQQEEDVEQLEPVPDAQDLILKTSGQRRQNLLNQHVNQLMQDLHGSAGDDDREFDIDY